MQGRCSELWCGVLDTEGNVLEPCVFISRRKSVGKE